MSTNTVKAITPKEALADKEKYIHPVVIEAVNALLIQKFSGSSVDIKLKDIIKKVLEIDNTLSESELREGNHLDFEPIYRKQGWLVKYDRPGYTENYDSFFTFTPKQD